jgi:hypothetical protein
MKRQAIGALLATGFALAISAATALPAAAATSGSETFTGTIVTSGASGTRTVISSVLVAKGVFTGAGQVVEVPNQPGDPDNVTRDDLVFRQGTMHLVSMFTGFTFSPDPTSCVATGTTTSTSQIDGGTGQFADATGSFTGTGTFRGVAARNPDGSCAFDKPALREVDMVTSTGTLSF